MRRATRALLCAAYACALIGAAVPAVLSGEAPKWGPQGDLTLPSAPPADWQARIDAGDMFWSPQLPAADRAPLIGNGNLAMNVNSDALFVAGVFNGNLTTSTTSHRARVPPYLWSMGSPNGSLSFGWALAVDNAEWMTRWQTPNGTTVEERWYAHYLMPSVLVWEVNFTAAASGGGDTFVITGAQVGANSSDVNLAPATVPGARAVAGATLVPEAHGAAVTRVAMVSSPAPPGPIAVPAGRTLAVSFVSAVQTSLTNATDPLGQAQADFENANAAAGAAPGFLRTLHESEFRKLNAAGRIEVEGDLQLAQVVNSSLYSILASARVDTPYGLSPGSLANNGYNGHTFWDQDTWMYPPMAYLHRELAESLVLYRINRQTPAKEKAAAHGAGGLWYPWESAFSGIEECPCGGPPTDPGWNGGAKYEQHVNGDIALAALQYWWLSGDLSWLQSSGALDMIQGLAQFWESRAEPCGATREHSTAQAEQYCIDNVMGPDEYHGGVNNSAYTNVIAAVTLRGAIAALHAAGQNAPPQWQTIADGMYVPFDSQRQYHPEYDSYDPSIKVKQADTVMLAYPLNYSMPTQVMINDLAVYMNSTDVNGPAMTWAVYSAVALDAGNNTLAAELFKRGYSTVRGDFKVWTETLSGGCTPFITGAGGFLQSVINGYIGVRVAPGGVLHVMPHAPPGNATALTAHGIDFVGNALSIRTNTTHASVTPLPSGSTKAASVKLVVPGVGDYPLSVGKTVVWKHAPARVVTM